MCAVGFCVWRTAINLFKPQGKHDKHICQSQSSLSMPPDGWMDGLDFRWSEQMPPRTPRMTIQSSNANNTSQGAGFT